MTSPRWLTRTAMLVALLSVASRVGHASQAPRIEGAWTGGTWLEGKWVAINVRFASQAETPGGAADILFPSYSGSESVTNATLSDFSQTADRVHFEIPFGVERAVLDGRRVGNTITGMFDLRGEKASFGVTSIADVTIESLEPYYGAYRVTSDQVISILRGWGDPRTLNYVDYQTGQTGTLWPSAENEFFSGTGRSISFPVTLEVSFVRDARGRVTSLSWRSKPNSQTTAQRIEVKEERVTFKNGDISLGGTLILPAMKGPHPLVIVTPGDYGTNRNQLRIWAHNYVSHGIAALVFDSRGAGESTGPVSSSSFSDLADDVLAGVQLLKMHAAIDPNRIGLFGFSNSAWTVALAASRSKDVSFLILQSFSGVMPWRQESFRAETQLRVDGFPASVVEQGAEFMRLKFEVARTGHGWEQLQGIMERARGEPWLAYTNPPRTLERLQQVYAASMTYDPVPTLQGLHVPVLAYWGGKDTYVSPSESIAIFERALDAAGNKAYVVKVYANGSHSLIETESGSPSRGAESKAFVAGLWKMQADWLREHVKGP